MKKHKKMLIGVAVGGTLVFLWKSGKIPMVKG